MWKYAHSSENQNKNKVLNTELLRNHKLLITQIKRHIYWDVRMGPAAGIEGQNRTLNTASGSEPGDGVRWLYGFWGSAPSTRVWLGWLQVCGWRGGGGVSYERQSGIQPLLRLGLPVEVFFPMILRALLSLSHLEQKFLTKPKIFTTWRRFWKTRICRVGDVSPVVFIACRCKRF